MPIALVATWNGGLFALADDHVHEELHGPVRGLASDGGNGALAIVGGKSLCRRAIDGTWSTVATGEWELACCVAAGDTIYVGADDAHVLRVRDDGTFEPLEGFDHATGREHWYAGTAIVDGRVVGPPLGVRSIDATCDRAALLANVHVGGIARSVDRGSTWHPTIDIHQDVHQVCAHPTRSDVVTAAAAVGLCVSRDGGITWSTEHEGLHASYCTAVAFAGDDILVAASTGHFASQGAIYRRSIDGDGPMTPVVGGLPSRLDDITDTGNIAALGPVIAVIDRAGNLYLSEDEGHTWARRAQGLPMPSGVLVR